MLLLLFEGKRREIKKPPGSGLIFLAIALPNACEVS